VTATGATAYNYGRETPPEGVRLIPVLVTGLGLTANPGINNSNAFGTFNNGAATGTTFGWDEVGVIRLIPGVADSNYLGAGDTQCNPDLANYGGTTACPSSGNVGRFYPDHFDTVVAQVLNVPMACPGGLGLACPATYPGFVYSGQSFNLSVTAMSASGLPTANYNTTSGFAKTTTLGAFGGLGVVTAPTGAGALGVASVSAFAAGTLTVPAESYTFTTTPTVATNIYIRAWDGEASSLRSVNPTTTSVEGGVAVASGRIRISNAYGSEQLPLPVTATVQYYNAAGAWLTSTTDNVTSFNPADLVVVPVTGLVPVNVTNVGPVTVAGGVRAFRINRPGVSGSADIRLSSPAYLLSVKGRVTFGVYKGANQFIYQREAY
jgi:MSHA biogenesis protein MshQ